MRAGPFARQREIVPGAASQATPAARLVFLRKVYALFLLGLGIAGLGGWVGAQTGLGQTNPLLLIVGYFITFFVCHSQRRVFPLNIALFGLFTFISGLLISPLIAYQLLGGKTEVLVQALGLTASIFGGLTIYTLTSRTDFSYLRGALSIGLFGMFGIIIIGWFTGGFALNFQFAFAIGVVVLFSGFVLYDTSQILHHYRTDEYVAGALSLYIDFIILFQYILMLLSRRD